MSERWTVLRVIEWTSERFRKQNIESPRLDAEVLLAHTLGVERIRLYMDYAKPLAADELASYRAMIKRRLAGEPVAYLVGHREFWSLDLEVGPGVLVPRPETELLVELAQRWIGEHGGLERPRIVDVGTGSGAIALAMRSEIDHADLLAVELSGQALPITRRNIARHGAGRVALVQGDLLDAVAPRSADLILSNPPYIARGELAGLPREVREHEPRRALDGGDDGLVLIRRLVQGALRCLRPGGGLLFEIGFDQGQSAAEVCRAAGLMEVEVHQDLAGLDRVVAATREA